MLRRAGVSFVIALLVGELARQGSPGTWAAYARIMFYVLLGFSLLSLLLSLFEEPSGSDENPARSLADAQHNAGEHATAH